MYSIYVHCVENAKQLEKVKITKKKKGPANIENGVMQVIDDPA